MEEFKARNVVKICITLELYDVIIAYSAATVNIFCKRKISFRTLSKSMIPGMRNPELLLGIVQKVSKSKREWTIFMILAFQTNQKGSDFLSNTVIAAILYSCTADGKAHVQPRIR